MNVPTILTTNLKKSVLQFTEQVTQRSIWRFYCDLKALHTGRLKMADTDIFVRTAKDGSAQGKLNWWTRVKESARFFWHKWTKFTQVQQEKLFETVKARFKPPVVESPPPATIIYGLDVTALRGDLKAFTDAHSGLWENADPELVQKMGKLANLTKLQGTIGRGEINDIIWLHRNCWAGKYGEQAKQALSEPLETLLKKHNIQIIRPAVGDVYDPNLHSLYDSSLLKTSNPALKGKIIEVHENRQIGYRFPDGETISDKVGGVEIDLPWVQAFTQYDSVAEQLLTADQAEKLAQLFFTARKGPIAINGQTEAAYRVFSSVLQGKTKREELPTAWQEVYDAGVKLADYLKHHSDAFLSEYHQFCVTPDKNLRRKNIDRLSLIDSYNDELPLHAKAGESLQRYGNLQNKVQAGSFDNDDEFSANMFFKHLLDLLKDPELPSFMPQTLKAIL